MRIRISTRSTPTLTGNLHGVPVAFFCGLPGFDAILGRPLKASVAPSNVMMLGIRSVDPLEQTLLTEHGVRVHGMDALDAPGVEPLLAPFLKTVARTNGLLHVSFDIDVLDPGIAPGVGTGVADGASLRQAECAMELVHRSGLMTSLDVVEFNPSLDDEGRTAKVTIDLVATLFGGRGAQGQSGGAWGAAQLEAGKELIP